MLRELRRCLKKLKINKRDFSFLETVGRIDVRWSLFMWEFVFYDFFDKGSAFWKAVICEKGEHSELAKAVSPSRALPLLATQLFSVVVGVNALTGCGIRGCWGWEVVSIGGCGREGGPLAGLFPESGGRNVLMVGPGCAAHFVRKILYSVSRQCIPG